jgi:hypothetical protein
MKRVGTVSRGCLSRASLCLSLSRAHVIGSQVSYVRAESGPRFLWYSEGKYKVDELEATRDASVFKQGINLARLVNW